MPLTREQRRAIVIQHGFDPSTHDYDETQQAILNYPGGIPQEQEVITEPALTPSVSSNTSALGAFGRAAAQSFGPSVAGLGAGALGTKIGAAVGGIPGAVIGGIGGAVGGSLLAGKAQEAIVPESIQQGFFPRPEDIQEHPVASIAGELAPSMLAMNPVTSARAVGRAAGLAGRMLTSPSGAKALTAAEKAALKNFAINAGVNAGVQGGMNIAGQMSSDQPFSYGSLARDIALGGLLNEPTRLGQRLFGFRPTFDGVQSRAELEAARLAQFEADLAARARATSQEVAQPPELPRDISLTEPIAPYKVPAGASITPEGDVRNPGVAVKRERLYPYETEVSPGADASRYEAVPKKGAADSAAAMEEARRIVSPETKAEDFKTALREKIKQEAEVEAEKIRAEILKGPILGSDVARPEVKPEPKVTTELGKELYPDYTGNLEFDAGAAKAESDTPAEILQKKLYREKYQGKSKSVEQFNTLEKDIKALMARRGIKPGKYRVELKDNEGNVVAGAAEVPARTVHLGKEAGADTAYHEAGHVYIDELARSSDPKDRELVSRAFSEMGHPELTAEEFVRLNDEYQKTGNEAVREKFIKAEEDLMDYMGFTGAKRKLTESKGREYFKDTLARFGIGKEAAKRKLSARMEYDAPREEVKTEGEKGANVKYQDRSELAGQEEAFLNKRITPTQEKLIRNYQKAHRKVNERVQYGEREEVAQEKSFVATWSNGSNSWHLSSPRHLSFEVPSSSYDIAGYKKFKEKFPKGLPNFLAPGNRVKLDSNQIIIPSSNMKEAELIVKKLPPLPLNKFSTENNPIFNKKPFSAEKLNEIKNFYKDFEEKKVELADEIENVSSFMDSIRSPEQNIEKYSKESKPLEPDELSAKKPFFNVFTSVTDKIRAGKGDSKSHNLVSSAAKNYFDEKSQLEGRYTNAILAAQKGYSPSEVERVYQYRWAKDAREPAPFELTPKEQELNAKLQPLIERPKIDANEVGLKVKRGEEWTPGGISKRGYLPNQMDPKFLAELTDNPNSIESKRIKRVWGEWLKKKGAENPEELIKNWEMARRDYGDTSGPEFNALRKAEGFGLPWELMEKNPARAWKRYGQRAAADVAFFKHLQSNDEIRAALGIKNQQGELPKDIEGIEYIGSEKNVQKMMKFVYGKVQSQFPRIEAFGRTIGSMVMGPGTAIRNLAALPPQLAGMDVKMREVFKGLSNIGKLRQEAFEQNVTKPDYAVFDRYSDYDNPDSVVNTLDKVSAFFRKWQGRDMSDKYESEILYAIGKEWAATKIAQAEAGNNRAARLLERVGNLAERSEGGKIEASEDNLKKLATGFVNVVRGSYGPQGLPSWALDGNLAPFVALSKYSIERWNNVYKDVITPLKNGDSGPFLKYTLASLIGGAGIEQLNELMTGRKGAELNINETLAAYAETQDPELIASKVIGLAQLSAYAGIVGDLAKMTERAISGKELKYSNPLSYPAYTFATETIASNLSQALGAIREGEDPIEILAEFIKTVGVQTIQGVRYAAGRIDEEGTQRKEEFADLRKYREAMGEPTSEAQSSPDEFSGLSAKKFKREEDLGEAVKQLPGLIQEAMKKAGNDPYKLKAELRKLKQNSYQSMPAPETQPIEFYEYLTYLRRTQGEQKASERLSKFLSQRQVNQVKAALVP